MLELDTLSFIQLVGVALTFLATVAAGVWAIRKNTGTDHDILRLFLAIGAGVFMTLIQIIAIMIRVG